MPRVRILLLFLLAPLIAPVAHADLKWAATMIYTAAAPSEGHATAQFTFTNTGTYPIKITSTHTSCGCTAAVASERSIPPGGTGKVDVSMKTINKNGLYEEPIQVETNDPKAKMSTITLRALVRDAVEIKPTVLFWQADEALAPKVTELTVNDGFDVKSVDATTDSPGLTIKLETVKAGEEYKLTVTPKGPHVKATISVTPSAIGRQLRPQTVHVRAI